MTTISTAQAYGMSLGSTEAVFLSEIRQVASLLGWRTYHTHDSRRSEQGFPDLVLVRGRRLVFAELKTARGKLTDAQRHWLGDLVGAGVEAYVWRPADWDDILKILKGRL